MTMLFGLCVISLAATMFCYQEENIRGLREKEISNNNGKTDELMRILEGACMKNSAESLKDMMKETQAIINNIGIYKEVVKKKRQLREEIKWVVEESKGQLDVLRIAKLLKRDVGRTCESKRVMDCSGFKGSRKGSGVYSIYPQKSKSDKIKVYCDMKTDGGGWTVIQRRIDGSTDFEKHWKDFEDGFGDVSKEFWLGNKYLNYITMKGTYELRIDLVKTNNKKTFAVYSKFSVGDAKTKYRISVGGYHGTAGDYLGANNGMKFSTKDQDNDTWGSNCAVNNGAWWYYYCSTSELNASLKKQKLRWGGRIYNQSSMMVRKVK
ncbi:fibrinogen-like protein A [Mytilus edulis]|uniref:fibrinogen-like protein A n=1 Tax=Mytilus edulis TaxID=6550 RepID=UPI0039F03401